MEQEIAERLKEARGDIPRETVAKAIGVTVSAISMYENGQRIPRDEFLGFDIEQIFFDKNSTLSRCDD